MQSWYDILGIFKEVEKHMIPVYRYGIKSYNTQTNHATSEILCIPDKNGKVNLPDRLFIKMWLSPI